MKNYKINPPLRILHLIYSHGIYGAEKYLQTLLPQLGKYGLECHLIFICPKRKVSSFKGYRDDLDKTGVKTTLLPVSSKVSFLLTARLVFNYLKSNNIKIIHSHLFSADFIAALIKKVFFKKLIILSSKHGYEEKYLVRYGLGDKKIPRNLYYYISKAVNKKINYSFAVSQAMSDLYETLKHGKSKMKFIHHGINPIHVEGKPVYISGDPKIIIIGRLSEMKGHRYLINAFTFIIQKFPKSKLIVLGEGPEKQKLINLAEKLGIRQHIEFAGFKNPAAYMPQCKIIVLPSLFEPFGLVYIESFAMKIPVIAFDTPAANEIIEDNKTGILVEKENVQQLAEKIIYLLSNPEKREQIVENAYKKYETYYNADRMVKETVEWYRTVLTNV